MLELEERVDSLEAIFGRFVINNDRTIRRLEQMMINMRHQADQEREQTNQILAEMRQKSAQDREQTNQILAEMRQQANQDRERTAQRFAQCSLIGFISLTAQLKFTLPSRGTLVRTIIVYTARLK